MNPLYQQIMGGGASVASQPGQVGRPVAAPMNPMMSRFGGAMARANNVMQAMQNPAAFVGQAFPDMPEGIANNPQQILQWLQQTRGITDAQIQQAAGMIPRF